MRNGVDVTVEGIGDAGDMPADGGGAFTVAWVRAGLVAGPHRLPSNKPHRRTQKNQSEVPVVTHGAKPPPSLAQLTADMISASFTTRP